MARGEGEEEGEVAELAVRRGEPVGGRGEGGGAGEREAVPGAAWPREGVARGAVGVGCAVRAPEALGCRWVREGKEEIVAARVPGADLVLLVLREAAREALAEEESFARVARGLEERERVVRVEVEGRAEEVRVGRCARVLRLEGVARMLADAVREGKAKALAKFRASSSNSLMDVESESPSPAAQVSRRMRSLAIEDGKSNEGQC